MSVYANQAYTQAAVQTASREQLVVMLYDGAIGFLQQALVALDGNMNEMAREKVQRADKILNELNVTLDMSQGEVAERLSAIYLFSKKEILGAVPERNPVPIKQVIGLLTELRGAWAEVASRAGTSAGAA